MRPSSLKTAVGLLAAVAGTVPGAYGAGIPFGRRTHQHDPHDYPMVALPASSTTTSAISYHPSPTCALEVVTSTTTLDITTTVTAPPSVTETPCSTSSSTSEPCTETTSTPSSSSEPCTDTTLTSVISSTTTEPCDSSINPSPTPTGSSTSTTTSSTQPTPYPIDTSMRPITTAAPSLTTTTAVTATNTLPPTTTVCETSAPTGTPAPRAVHCGVHGVAVGDFFLGRYVEERAGVAVSLEGCWAFCKTAWGATNGCQSYDYYLNELGAPRCDLYSSRVAFALDKVDNNQGNLWFDLECGNPADARWAHTHTHPHTARAAPPVRSIRGGKRV